MTTANLTLVDNETVIQYESTGEDEFDFNFPILSTDELKVSVDQVLKTIGADYSVSGVGDAAGGTVTFNDPTTAGERVTLWLDLPIKRLTGFALGASTLLPQALNTEFIRQVRIDQMLRRDIRRSLRIPVDDPEPGQDLELPTASVRAGKFLRFDETTGNPEVATLTELEDGVVVLSRSIIGQYFYPLAGGETVDMVVNYFLEYGHIERYGTHTIPGTTNMAVALQRAFDSGFEVHGERTTYNCGAVTIDVPDGARARLYGVKLKTDVDEIPFLDITGDDVELLGGEIEGGGNGSLTDAGEIMIRCVGASAAAYRSKLRVRDMHIHESGFYGVYCEFAQDVLIEGCDIHDIRHAGVGGQSVTRMRVNYNTIHDIGPGSSGNSYGVFFSRTEGLGDLTDYPRPSDCEAIGNLLYNITEWEALDTHTGERIVFAHNVIRNCLLGINVSDDADDYPPRDVSIIGNLIESDTLSADPYRAIGSGGANSGNRARNIVCIGNVIRGYGLDSVDDGAIMFQFTDGLVVADNIIEDSRGVAICVLQVNEDFVVSGNCIRGVRAGVGNASGIYLRQPNQVGHIADNFIDATAEIGIFLTDPSTGVSFGRNRIITSGSRYSGALFGGEGLEVEGSETLNVASIADGDQAQFTITVAGAEVGDYVVGITCSISTAALSLTGTVTAQDTVTAVLQNNTGGAVDLGSATYQALVRKR